MSPDLGERVRLHAEVETVTVDAPEDIALEILFEDADLIVINKPAGLVVHPAAGHASGTLVNALLHHFQTSGGTVSTIGGKERPGLVHRLDKETSGVMVITKTDIAHRALAAQFKDELTTLSEEDRARFVDVTGERIALIGREDGPFEEPRTVAAPGGDPSRPEVARGPLGDLHVVYSYDPDSRGVGDVIATLGGSGVFSTVKETGLQVWVAPAELRTRAATEWMPCSTP